MKTFIHRVAKGETIDYIEKKYNMPRRKIFEINKMDYIYEGQWLYIESIEGFYYAAKPFDTLESIANKFRVDFSQLCDLNGGENCFIGMKVLIPLDENHREEEKDY